MTRITKETTSTDPHVNTLDRVANEMRVTFDGDELTSFYEAFCPLECPPMFGQLNEETTLQWVTTTDSYAPPGSNAFDPHVVGL